MKNKIIQLCSIALVVLCGFLTVANAMPSLSEIGFNDEEYLERNWARVELATKIENKIMDRYEIKNAFEDIYPNYFGGIYVSDDARNLIIQIVEKNIPQEGTDEYKFYKEITTMDEAIKIEYVNYSFNELNEVNNQVSTIVGSEDKFQGEAMGGYIDVMNNSIVVEMKDDSVAKQQLVKNAINKGRNNLSLNISNSSKIIRFVNGNYVTTSATHYVNAGQGLGVDNYCSMGFRVKYYSTPGFVTAGHCVTEGTYITEGRVKYVQYSDHQKYDYAFVQTDSNYIPTNTLEFQEINIMTLSVEKTAPSITVNMSIAKAGATTGYTSGKVTGLNQSVTYNNDGKTINGLVKSDLKHDKGDSGGTVFIPRVDSNGGSIPIGVLSGGGNGFLGIGRTMYFTSINDMHTPIKEGRY